MMAWLWLQALGTVFLESGINNVIHIFCSPLIPGEINVTAYSCEKKFYLIFAGENFSIEIIIYKKKLSVNYKKKWKKKNQNKAKVPAEINRTSVLI